MECIPRNNITNNNKKIRCWHSETDLFNSSQYVIRRKTQTRTPGISSNLRAKLFSCTSSFAVWLRNRFVVILYSYVIHFGEIMLLQCQRIHFFRAPRRSGCPDKNPLRLLHPWCCLGPPAVSRRAARGARSLATSRRLRQSGLERNKSGPFENASSALILIW